MAARRREEAEIKKGKVIKSCRAATLDTFCGSREEPQGGRPRPGLPVKVVFCSAGPTGGCRQVDVDRRMSECESSDGQQQVFHFSITFWGPIKNEKHLKKMFKVS